MRLSAPRPQGSITEPRQWQPLYTAVRTPLGKETHQAHGGGAWGLEFRVQGSGIGVQGLGPRVQAVDQPALHLRALPQNSQRRVQTTQSTTRLRIFHHKSTGLDAIDFHFLCGNLLDTLPPRTRGRRNPRSLSNGSLSCPPPPREDLGLNPPRGLCVGKLVRPHRLGLSERGTFIDKLLV